MHQGFGISQIFKINFTMNQNTYNTYRDIVKSYRQHNLNNINKQAKLNKYISRIEKLLDDEYHYGSSYLDLYFLNKYVDKCKKLLQ